MIVSLRDVDMKKPVQSKKLKQNNNLDGLKKEDKEALDYMEKEFGKLLKKYNKNNNKKQITKLFAITYDVGKKTYIYPTIPIIDNLKELYDVDKILKDIYTAEDYAVKAIDELNKKEKEVEKLQTYIDKQNYQIENLNKQNEKLKNDFDKLNESAKSLHNATLKLKQKYIELESSNKEKDRKLNEKDKIISEKDDIIRQQQEEIERLRKMLREQNTKVVIQHEPNQKMWIQQSKKKVKNNIPRNNSNIEKDGALVYQ